MFTGIIEAQPSVKKIEKEGTNVHFTLQNPFGNEIKVDQSIAHNGVCLTVVETNEANYRVTAIKETLERSNLGKLKVGGRVNVERCMQMNGRLDGHIVQGHVDQTALVESIKEEDGSWYFGFTYHQKDGMVTVPKGSITVNGVSLTVVDSEPGRFSVAIIPYTYEHTNFHQLKIGDMVNLEFDIIGKYVAQYLKNTQ